MSARDNWASDHQLRKWKSEQLTAKLNMYQVYAMVEELQYHREREREAAQMNAITPDDLILMEEVSASMHEAIGYKLRRLVENLRRLQKGKKLIVDALNAVLLFHGSNWDAEQRFAWHNLTEYAEATTKGLCDFIRKRLEATKDA